MFYSIAVHRFGDLNLIPETRPLAHEQFYDAIRLQTQPGQVNTATGFPGVQSVLGKAMLWGSIRCPDVGGMADAES